MRGMNNSLAAPGPFGMLHPPPPVCPSDLVNLSLESEDGGETSEPIWIKASTGKWEV